MIVNIPSPLRSYTANRSQVDGTGSCVSEMLAALDKNYPGIRFRMIDEQDGIRQHIRIFVNTHLVDDLSQPLNNDDVVHIICALSGG